MHIRDLPDNAPKCLPPKTTTIALKARIYCQDCTWIDQKPKLGSGHFKEKANQHARYYKHNVIVEWTNQTIIKGGKKDD